MAGSHLERACRELDINGKALKVFEHTELSDEAGAVVWDAGLVLLNYFCRGKLTLSLVALPVLPPAVITQTCNTGCALQTRHRSSISVLLSLVPEPVSSVSLPPC